MSNGFKAGPMAQANTTKKQEEGFTVGPMGPASEYERTGRYPSATVRKEKKQTNTTKQVEYTTGTQIKQRRIADITSQMKQQVQEIDPRSEYRLSSGKIVTGKELRGIIVREGVQDIQKVGKDVKPGYYIEKSNNFFHTSPEQRYIISKTTPEVRERIIQSIDVGSPNPYGRSEYSKALEQGYSLLSDIEKEEYGYQFQPFKGEPVETWNLYPGGKKYVEQHKNEVVERYIKQKGGLEKVPYDIYKYASIGGIYSGKLPNDPQFLREAAWENIYYDEGKRRETYFNRLPAPAQWFSSGTHMVYSGASFPITLPQMAVKYVRGKGAYTEPFERIATGETFGPDIGNVLLRHEPGGPSGLISTGIQEGLYYVPKDMAVVGALGGHKTNAVERFMKHPVSGAFATGGEVLGLLVGGYGLSKAKQVTGAGLYRIGSPIKKSLVSQGIMKDLPLSRYSPTSIMRTGFWKAKQRLGIAEFVPEEKVWASDVLYGGKRFAEAKNVNEMVQRFYESQTKFPRGSSDNVFGIHATTMRFGKLARVKPGLSETTGLSVSAFGEGSPHFLRTTGYGTSKLFKPIRGISLFPKIKMPTGIVTRLKDIYRLPKNLRKPLQGETTKSFYGRVSKYLQRQESGPYATIAAKAEIGGPEIEAIIRYGSLGKGQWLKRASSRYFTTYKGKTVPLPEYVPLGKNIPQSGSVMFTGKQPSMLSYRVKKLISPYSYTVDQSLPLLRKGYIISSVGRQLSKKGSSVRLLSSKQVGSNLSSFGSYDKKLKPLSLKSDKIISMKSVKPVSVKSFTSHQSLLSKKITSTPIQKSSLSYKQSSMAKSFYSTKQKPSSSLLSNLFDEPMLKKKKTRKGKGNIDELYRFREKKVIDLFGNDLSKLFKNMGGIGF